MDRDSARLISTHKHEPSHMTLTTWIVAILSVGLPSDYVLVQQKSEQVVLQLPPGTVVAEEYRSWKSAQGKTIHLQYWAPYPARPGGPMVVQQSYPVVVADQATKILETSQFMGTQGRALVVHMQFSKPQASALLYSYDMSLQEFRSAISDVRAAQE